VATLSSITPNHAALGEPPVGVNVVGTGFTATSKIHADGVAIPTTYNSGTSLGAVVDPSDHDSLGTIAVKVEEPAGTFTAELPFSLGIHSGQADGGVLVEAPDPWPYEFQYVADTNHLATVIGTVGWPDGAQNT
jgi:hypothetical protein